MKRAYIEYAGDLDQKEVEEAITKAVNNLRNQDKYLQVREARHVKRVKACIKVWVETENLTHGEEISIIRSLDRHLSTEGFEKLGITSIGEDEWLNYCVDRFSEKESYNEDNIKPIKY